MVYRYSPEVHEFVRKWCTQLDDEDLTRICNECFGTEFTRSKMKTFRGNHGYKSNRRSWRTSEEYWETQTRWPQGMLEFVRNNSWHVPSKDLAEMVNEEFGTDYTPMQIKAFRQRNGIKSGITGWFQKNHSPGNKGKKIEEYVKDPARIEEIRRRLAPTQFKKGERPMNELPVGSISLRRKDGKIDYKFIKVQMEGGMWDRWKPLHRYVWEKHNGPIPEGMCVCFKDGDPLNCDISNLMLAKRQEIVTMAKKDLWSEDPDLTETAIYMIRLQQAANARKRGKS